jgi:hypothetical protein
MKRLPTEQVQTIVSETGVAAATIAMVSTLATID